MTKASVSIYACGGTGINIAKGFSLPSIGAYPEVKKFYIDTSRANVSEEDKNVFIIPGFENGSGSNRAEVYRNFDGHQSDYINTNKPGAFNIVIFSLAGGTGNASGLLIMEEMLKRKIPVIAIVVTETNSKTRADASYSSFRSFMNFAEKGKLPFSAIFLDLSSSAGDVKGEGNSGTRLYIVDRANKLMNNICYIASEKHSDLDRRDVATFINYPDITGVPARLSEIVVVDPTLATSGVHNQAALSAVEVLSSKTVSSNINALYIKSGYYDLGGDEEPKSVAMLITSSLIKTRLDRLKAKVDDYNQQIMAFMEPAASDESGDDRGFV